MRDIKLDADVADKIALASMKNQLTYLRNEVIAHEKKGSWMHPEDYHESKVHLIPALQRLIKYYGG